VTLIKLASDEKLVGLERVQEPSEVEGEELLGEDGEIIESEALIIADEDASTDELQADAAPDEEESQD
jgi:DNA gyrase subunit A